MGSGTKERHDAIAHDLVDGAFIAMHRLHHALQDGVEQLPGLLRVALGQEFQRTFEIRKQHGDLLALAFEGTARGENFFGQVGRRVGEWGTVLAAGWESGWVGRGNLGSRPH